MSYKRILKKLLFSAITIFFVLVFNYILFRVVPGNPLSMISRNARLSEAQIQKIRETYGLDKPWNEQFMIYLKNLASFDFGNSFTYKKPVMNVISEKIFPTILLLGISEILAIILGIVVGCICAWKRGKKIDTGLLSSSLLLYSMPTFWFGMILIMFFCVFMHALPTGGMITPGRMYPTEWIKAADVARHMIMPVICMGFAMIGEYAITMRSTMMEVLQEDYITTAKAKGFSNRYILRKHAMPNAMLPMITIIAINLSSIVGGAIQIETVFSWPGVGNLMYSALNSRDYPLLQGLFLIITVSVVLANVLADILYEVIDPRIRKHGGKA